VVKQADTGRPANSLARHGLLICWMTKDPRWSVDEMVTAFFLMFHRHQFVLPNDDYQYAAWNVQGIAIQEICPSLADEFERKGGPLNPELVSP
jgi:hypothetical protein